MPIAEDTRAWLDDLFQPVRDHTGDVTLKAMFGGIGVFTDGMMFSLIAGDDIYLKVDADNKERFEDAGLGPFMYDGKNGKPMAMSYHRLPDDALDDPDVLLDWAMTAVEAARRAAAKKKPKKKKA